MSPLAAMAEELRAFFNQHKVLCGGILVVCAGVTVHRCLRRRKTQNKRKAYPRDTVILHDVGRGPYAPSAVPATVKLETYLRMAKIPYQYEFSLESSSKQKWPWVTFNGEDVADSAFIIQFLNRRYDLDLSAWLSAEQRSVAVAFQRLAEENLYWVLVVTRWVNEAHLEFLQKVLGGRLSGLYIKMAAVPYVRNAAWSQGMGRHSHQEVKEIARKDLTALSNYLGRKKFLMGDQPCEEDCAVFGQLSQLYWHLPGSVSAMLKEEFPVLVAYCERMKDTFWPDWLQCTTQGGTVAATH